MSSYVMPEMHEYKVKGAFRFWCQKVLPAVYDDSLSYYELLCKVVEYLNTTMEDVNNLTEDVTNLYEFVDNYFTNLDVTEEINSKLDEMAEDGTLYDILERFTTPIIERQDNYINTTLAAQNSAIDVLEARMDEFSSLPSGSLSTDADAELVDIRVGYNGETYSNAGTAVRTQVRDLYDIVDYSLYTVEGGVINGLFVGSNINNSGATTSNTARLRTDRMSRAGREVVKLENGSYEYCAYGYSDEGYSNWQSTYIGENTGWINGANPLRIPENYEYYALTFRRVDLADVTTADADAISSTIKTYTEAGPAIVEQLNHFIEIGNNLIPLKNFHVVINGVTIDINNGVLSLRGTSTGYIRTKLSGGYYEANYSAREVWGTERLTGFENGEYYSLHNEILYGALPSNVGVSLRDENGSVIISASVPQTLLSATPAYVMLYIPTGINVNVDFIPMIIKGTLDAKASSRILNKSVHISAEQILDLKTYEMPDLSSSYLYNSTYEYAIKLPSNYSAKGDPTPLIILAHGLNSTLNASHWGSEDMDTMVQALGLEGYAVIDVNRVTTQDWCNPALIDKYVEAIKQAMKIYNVKPKFVYAESMGNLIGLCLSKLYPGIKACIVAGLRMDFEARYELLDADQKAIVDENLGFVNGYDAYTTAGYNVCAFNCTDSIGNPMNPIQFPPIFFMIGTEDTVTAEESYIKVTEIKRGGTICKIQDYVANHNEVCYLKSAQMWADALAWLEKWA